MKKRMFAVLLAAVLIFGLLPPEPMKAAVIAYSENVTGGNIYFDTSTGTVTRSDTGITSAVIPDVINGVAVKAIGENAFSGRRELTSVTLPDSLETIGNYAFRNDESLESVTWKGKPFDPFEEKSGVEVGYLAFTDCFFLRPDFSPSYKSGLYYRNLHSDSTRKLLKGKRNYLSDVIVIAKSQLGYHEGDSYEELDGNAYGYGDYSEYTCWWGEPGQMWCGEFVGWCIAMASVPEEVFHRKYQTPAQYTWEETGYAGKGGSYTLKQGDVLHFDYNGGNHVCLVYGTQVNSDTVKITTLDGNHSNDVSWGSYIIDKATGSVTNDWNGKDARITTIYAPDVSQTEMEKLTFYKLHFDVNGGEPLSSNQEDGWFMKEDEKEITCGASYGIMPLPTRKGYDFAGWYTKPEEGMDGDHLVTSYRIFKEHEDQTLYARWAEYDTGKDPGEASGSGKVYNSKKEVTAAGYTWEIDADTGTITKFPGTWPGGNVPTVLDETAVKAVADNACPGNRNIRTLFIPEGVTELGAGAFRGCGALTDVRLPASLRSIGAQCFMNCYELENIEFAGDLDDIRKDRYSFYRTPWFHGDFSEEYKHGPWYPELLKLMNGIDTAEDPELTGTALSDLTKIGVSQMGYHEGDTREELTGLNPNGTGEYAEPVFFSGSPDYLWFKNVPQRSYGGWCGQYCSWVLRMAGLPDEASGMLNNNTNDELKWEDLTLAGGTHVLKAGDVLHMRIGHYCIVAEVTEKDGWVYVKTLNGNHGNAVSWDTYRLDPATGWQKTDGTKDNYDVTDIYAFRPETLDTADKYLLRFNAAGGSVPVDSKPVYEGAFYGLLPEPVWEDHVFLGWYTAPAEGKKVTPYRMVRDSDTDVTVYARWEENTASVTGISMGSAGPVIVKIGENKKLMASVLPLTASNKDIIWRSADQSIATVTENGTVKGVEAGEVNIIAETADGHYMGKTSVLVSDGSLRYPLNDGEGFIWFNKDTGIVTGVEPEKEELHIPSSIDGTTVTEIGRKAFMGESSISQVHIPDTVVRIGVAAFERSGLTTLTIPSSVREIRGFAFSSLSSLTSLEILGGTTWLYSGAFSDCPKLTTVDLPNSVRYIYSKAFDGCEALSTATFQGSRNNLGFLDETAFPEGCSLVFGEEDFTGEDDYVPKSEEDTTGNYEIGTRESDYEIDENGIITRSAYKITNAQIPETIGGITVRGFKEFAFGTRTGLRSLSIPSTVKEIGKYSFWTCTGLETLYIPDTVESIGDYAFGVSRDDNYYIGSLTSVTIGKGIRNIGKYVFVRQNALKEIRIHAKKSEVTVDHYSFPEGVQVIWDEEDPDGGDDPVNPGPKPDPDPDKKEEESEDPDSAPDPKEKKPGEDDVADRVTEEATTKTPVTVNGESVTAAVKTSFDDAVDYTGNKIAPKTLLSAEADLDDVASKITYKTKKDYDAKKLLKTSFVSNDKGAGKASFYTKLTLDEKKAKKAGLSKAQIKEIKAFLKEVNRAAKENPCTYRIVPVSLPDAEKLTVKATLKKDGTIKKVRSIKVKATVNGKKKTFTLKKGDYDIAVVDAKTKTVSVTGIGNFTGTREAVAKK